jgi:hypothetical protein
MTYTFPRDRSSEVIAESIKRVQEEMQEKGLMTEETTFEDMADYAGRHVVLTEKTK